MQAVGLATSFSSRQFGLSTKLLSFSASQFAAGLSDGPGLPAAVALLVGRNFWLYRSITLNLVGRRKVYLSSGPLPPPPVSVQFSLGLSAELPVSVWAPPAAPSFSSVQFGPFCRTASFSSGPTSQLSPSVQFELTLCELSMLVFNVSKSMHLGLALVFL